MMRIATSPAAAGLLRSLLARGGTHRDRILLTEFRSVDWQSLTFIGERHQFQLRLTGPEAGQILSRLVDDLSDGEFDIPGHLRADIALAGEPRRDSDGSITVALEALTVASD